MWPFFKSSYEYIYLHKDYGSRKHDWSSAAVSRDEPITQNTRQWTRDDHHDCQKEMKINTEVNVAQTAPNTT